MDFIEKYLKHRDNLPPLKEETTLGTIDLKTLVSPEEVKIMEAKEEEEKKKQEDALLEEEKKQEEELKALDDYGQYNETELRKNKKKADAAFAKIAVARLTKKEKFELF